MRLPLPDPRERGLRLPGYDLIRGLTVILMLFINFSDVFFSRSPGPFDRRAAVILVTVSGAGLSLMVRQLAGNLSTCRRLLRNRALFLVAGGYLLSLIWSGDILHFYGIFILTGIYFLDKSLGVLAVAMLLAALLTLAQTLGPVAFVLEETQNLFLDPIKEVLFTGYFPVFPWMIFFLAGMCLGRLSLAPRFWAGLLVLGVFLAVSQEVTLPGFFHIISDPSSGLPFTIFSGIGTGLAAISLGHCLSGLWTFKKYTPVLLLGRTSLTLYIAHILFIWALTPVSGIITGKGPVLAAMALFLVLYIILIRRWFKIFPKGPLETLMRRFDAPAGLPGNMN